MIVNNPLVLRAHIAELEELRDEWLALAKDGHADAAELVGRLHREAMARRSRLRNTDDPRI
jgi:hypothetical protein